MGSLAPPAGPLAVSATARLVLAVLLGATVASFTFFAIGVVANAVHPTPPELMDPATPEAVVRRVAATPLSVWMVVVLGSALGAFAGGAVGARLAPERRIAVTSAIGALHALWAAYTFYVVYPEVLWVPAAMLLGAVGFAHLGGVVAARWRRAA